MTLFLPSPLLGCWKRCCGRFAQARAQELQLETQVISRLDGLLKRCGKDPGSAQAISNWLCAEGLEGHAKKGLSRILWWAALTQQFPYSTINKRTAAVVPITMLFRVSRDFFRVQTQARAMQGRRKPCFYAAVKP